ncbi:hypothetical protein OCO_46340 [Mycobacterium intracellulare MOTT-02]|uniref:Uncharacterized protein n=1 Tax=Mycobacterium intracellulare (strain ATCC 13950 / DSM 43223 / JCM 6384 / NCTC 13025 / 3600) TaxID=487521 RepID=H8IUG2_MYCIA|nr:hypothetical protein OCU_46060 [Mycobacterium intracellulare ATCC 13950]AFC50997.1 hypothetical protein OCO_46340 [Mycobacterium intracellulare MOTT-02]ETZ32232.1 hypothetical protein L843_4942 [Mycobacterium intracellulare MIN_061107_1834]
MAARNRAGGHGGCSGSREGLGHFSSPYAGITRSGSYGRRPRAVLSAHSACAPALMDGSARDVTPTPEHMAGRRPIFRGGSRGRPPSGKMQTCKLATRPRTAMARGPAGRPNT